LRRRLLYALLGVLGGVAVLATGVLWFVTSAPGERLVRDWLVRQANGSLAGQLSVERLELGLGSITLSGLALEDPEGRTVAQVERAEAEISLWALTRRQLVLREVHLVRPEVLLRQGEPGLGLGRALARRHSTPEVAPRPAPTLQLSVHQLTVEGGTLELEGKEGAVLARLEELRAQGGGHYASPARSLELRLEAQARSSAAPEGPVRLVAIGQGHEGLLSAEVALSTAALSLEAEGTVDMRRWYAQSLTARLRRVDLSRLPGGGPVTHLSADMQVRGGGRSLEELEVAVELAMPASTVEGHQVGPVALHARLERGQLQLSQLRVQVPGATLTAHGGGSVEDMHLEGRLEATHLSTLASTLGRTGRGRPLPLAGQGTVDFSLHGPLRRPGLTLRAQVPALSWEQVALSQLSLEAEVPDLSRPLHANASLRARRLHANGQAFHGVESSLTTRGPALAARLRSRGPELAASLQGTVDGGGRALSLSALTLRFPEGTWRLRKPTRIALEGGRLAVAPLTLSSGPQSLSLALQWGQGQVEGQALLRAVDLGRLPRSLLPPSLRLGGRLSGRVEARGALPRPRLEVALDLRGGRYQEHQELNLVLASTYAKDRAKGTLEAHTPMGRLSARFDTPVEGLWRRRREPVAVDLSLERLEPSRVLALAGRQLPLVGTLSGTVHVEGLASAPRVAVELQGQQLQWRRPLPGGTLLEPMDMRLTARSALPEPGREAERSPVHVQLQARRGGRALADASASLELPLAELDSLEDVGSLPVQLSARVASLPLREVPWLGARARQEQLQGVLSAELAAHGTLEAPRVELTARLMGAGLPQVALGQVHLHYTYADSRSSLEASLDSPGSGSLRLSGHSPQKLSLSTLRRGLEPRQVPVELQVQARDFDPTFLSAAVPGVRSLGGSIEADARLTGMFADPTFRGHLEWHQGRLGLERVGEYRNVELVLDATERQVRLTRLSVNGRGGSLEVTGEAHRQGPGPFAFTGQGEASDFPVYSDEQLVALVSLRSRFEGSLSRELVNVRRVLVSQAHITLPEEVRKDLQSLDRPNDIMLVRNGVPVERQGRAQPVRDGGGSGRPEPRLRYVVNVEAPRNLWVRGADMDGEVGLSEDFRFEYAGEPQLYGEIRALRGEVQVLGRRFRLQRDSLVRFTGPVRKPYVDAVGEYENEREGVKVLVNARGQGKDFELKVSSEPPLAESEIYMLLATGRRNLRPNSGNAGTAQVTSAVGSYLASAARKLLAGRLARLPVDVVSIEGGDDGLGLQGAGVEVGSYVSDKVYISGRVSSPSGSVIRRQNSVEGRVEYQVTPQWGVEARVGDASQGVNLFWGRDY
jgi:autotransporter translocation and assembly factor TamB